MDVSHLLADHSVRKSPRLQTRISKTIAVTSSRDLSFDDGDIDTFDAVLNIPAIDIEMEEFASVSTPSEVPCRKRKTDDCMLKEDMSDFRPQDMNNHDTNNFDLERHIVAPKRPRPRQSILEKLQSSAGFVDKGEVSDSQEESSTTRRRPRMAGLNAIAKVNAVLDSYAIISRRKSDVKSNDNISHAASESRTHKKRSGSLSVEEAVDKSHKHELGIVKADTKLIENNDILSANISYMPNIAATLDSGKLDKGVQTRRSNHKSVQTDVLSVTSHCTCRKSSRYNLSNKEPAVMTVPISSLIQTDVDTHKIYIPFTKTHLLTHTDLKDVVDKPDFVSKAKNSKSLEQLNKIVMNNALVLYSKSALSDKRNPHKSLLLYPYHTGNATKTVNIKIPKINFAASSTSRFSTFPKSKVFTPVKAITMRKYSTTKDGTNWGTKMINGWVFGGETMEKPFVYDDCIVTRRYYTCMRRSNDVINIRDSVLLKSGTRKKDLPYVARVAAIWEEDEGPRAGDMMVSVFWYYRPEQTEADKIPGFHGEMEVLASRHRDDNSVACIVDKCYVLSYSQYCRFRAKSCLYRESREKPLSVVPPSESTRPGSMPPPNIEPSLVFFGRQVYDYRNGRILKTVM